MPTYTFKCLNPDCRLEFDNHLSIEDRNNEMYCPECAELGKRIYSPFSLIGFDNLGRSR